MTVSGMEDGMGSMTREELDGWIAFSLSERVRSTLPADADADGSLSAVAGLESDRWPEAEPSDYERERMIETLLDRCLAPGDSGEDAAALPEAANDRGPSEQPSVVPRRRPWSSPWAWAGLVAAAAALLLWLLPSPDPGPSGESRPGLAPLTDYELEYLDPWAGSIRGDPPAADLDRCSATYHRERPLRLRLRAARDFGDDVVVAARLRTEAGEEHWIDAVPSRVSAAGVITIDQPLAQVPLDAGRWSIQLFVMRSDQRVERPTLGSLEPGAHPGVTVIEASLCVVES